MQKQDDTLVVFRGGGPPSHFDSLFNILLIFRLAHESNEGLVYSPFWREPLVGVPGGRTPRSAGHHSDIYGPADHCCDCQQERAQTQG